MARDLKPKKRKEPSEATRSSKKLKQAPATESTESAKTAKTLEPTLSDDINPAAVKAKASRKRAADYLNEDQIGSSNEGTLNGVSKSTGNAKVAKKAKLGGKVEASHKRETAEEPEEEGEGSAVLEEEELDDHTAALLKGFESSEDEEEVENDEAAIEEIPPIPNDQSLKKSLKNAAGDTDEAGVLYVGHIPHGFYEQQMRSYFSQFGDVTRLRLSRNPKTGKPRHYAFVEFASSEVATIVAKTMDKYLMFGHILQVRTIPKEQVHENLFQGANRRFKPIPRAKLEARKLRAPKSKEEWNKKVELEEAKRKAKLDKLKEIGYEFEAPVIKVSGSLTADSKTIEASADSPQRLLTETPHGEEEQKEVAPSKTKASGARKAKAKPVEEEVPTEGRATRASRTSTRIAQAQKTGRTKAR